MDSVRLSLGEYFMPLSWSSALTFILCLIVWDSVGYLLSHRWLYKFEYLRTVYWLFGMGFWVFGWFLLHFFVPFSSRYVWWSLFGLGMATLPYYVRRGGWRGLFGLKKKSLWFVILLAPLLPIVFVKASLPPYYFDEMAYQYYSPRNYIELSRWDFFAGGLYQNLPRLLNTGYYLMFGLSKSYALARVLHFAIFVSVCWSIYLWMRKRIGLWPAIFFLALFWYLPIDLPTTATLGYVDIAAVALIVLGAVLLIDNLVFSKPSLIPAAMVWAMALGVKYTSAVSLAAMGTVWLTIRMFLMIQGRSLQLIWRRIGIGTLFAILLGGYWYIKNLVLFGNPIFPFILPCKEGLAEKCQTGSAFFAGWTLPITIENVGTIVSQLFVSDEKLVGLFVVAVIWILWSRRKHAARVGLVLLSMGIFELLVLKQISGFYLRYNQHLQVLILMVMCLPVLSTRVRGKINLVYTAFFALVIALQGYRTLRYVYYSPTYVQSYELEYALGRTDIWGWLSKKFSLTNEIIRFCDLTEKEVVLTNVDPDLIWFEYEGMMRVFLTNCRYNSNPLGASAIEELATTSKGLRLEMMFASINPCVSEDKIRRLPYENDNQKHLRRVNNWLVCNSRLVLPNLYRFDYREL